MKMTKLWFERTDIDELVKEEGKRIYEKWGLQELTDRPNLPKETDEEVKKSLIEHLGYARELKKNYPSWLSVLLEEVNEACVEEDPEKKKAELVQVMAVARQWWDAIDRKQNNEANNN